MSLTVDTYTKAGKKAAKKTKLPESIFGQVADAQLIAQAIRVYLANQRQATRDAKSRSEVKLTTAKVWRQKGTGRARHGSRRAPIFVGGGTAHGPNPYDNFSLKLTKKMKRKALYGSLTSKCQEGKISVIESIDFKGKTKNAISILKLVADYPNTKKILLVIDKPDTDTLRAINNLQTISATQAYRLNTYETLNHDRIIFISDAIKSLEDLHKKDQNPTKDPKPSKSSKSSKPSKSTKPTKPSKPAKESKSAKKPKPTKTSKPDKPKTKKATKK